MADKKEQIDSEVVVIATPEKGTTKLLHKLFKRFKTKADKQFNGSNFLKRVIVYTVIILVVLILIGVADVATRNARAAFIIDGQRYSRSQLSGVIKSAATHKVSAHSAEDKYISVTKSLVAFTKLNAQIDSNNLNNSAANYGSASFGSLDAWEKVETQEAATNNQLALDQSGYYSGFIFMFPYDRDIVHVDGVTEKSYGDASQIQSDKDYAQQQATAAQSELSAGKLTDAALLKRLTTDPRLYFAGGGNDSLVFTADSKGTIPLNGSNFTSSLPPFVTMALNQFKKPGFNKVATLYQSFSPEDLPAGYANITGTGYYFIHVTNISASQPHIASQFAQAVKNEKVSIHVKN